MTNLGRFVAELRVGLRSVDDWPLIRSMLTTASERAAATGQDVHLVSATFHPPRGILRCAFSAISAIAVEELLEAANLPPVVVEPVLELPCHRLDPPEGHR